MLFGLVVIADNKRGHSQACSSECQRKIKIQPIKIWLMNLGNLHCILVKFVELVKRAVSCYVFTS